MTDTGNRKTVLRRGYRFKNRWVIGICALVDQLLRLFCRKRRPFPETVSKIVLIKPDHLGDLLMLTSILPLLKGKFAAARIDIVCGAWALPVLENNPYLAKRIILNHPAYNRGKGTVYNKVSGFIKTLTAALKVLRREKYDLCLNLRDAAGDMILLARAGSCRYIIGHGTGGFGPLLDAVAEWHEGIHETGHFLEVAALAGIGADAADLQYQLHPGESDYHHVNALVQRLDLVDFIVIHPGSGDRRKLKGGRFWAEVIREHGSSGKVVITGSHGEEHLAAEIAGAAGRDVVNLVGTLSILQLLILFRQADHIFALDSLAAHVAGLSATATTVFWNELNDAEQWRPLGKNVAIALPHAAVTP